MKNANFECISKKSLTGMFTDIKSVCVIGVNMPRQNYQLAVVGHATGMCPFNGYSTKEGLLYYIPCMTLGVPFLGYVFKENEYSKITIQERAHKDSNGNITNTYYKAVVNLK